MGLWRSLVLSGLLGFLLVGAGCAPAAAPAQPTAAPPKPTAAPAAPAAPAKPTAAPAAAKPAEKAADPAAPSQALIDAAKAEGSLIVYNNIATESATYAFNEFTKKYGIKVDFTKKTGGETMALVDAQRKTGKVKADLLGMGDEVSGSILAEWGVLAKYQPETAKNILPEARDPEGFWVPHHIALALPVYNTRKVKKEELPKTYKEMADPKWRGRLATSPSRGSGTGSIFVNAMVNTFGWSYFEELAKNEPLLISSVSALPTVAIGGESDIVFPVGEHITTPLIKKGEPLGFFYPTDVIPVAVTVWGLTKDAPNPNAARLFMHFVLTEELQAGLVKNVGARGSIVQAPSPEGGADVKALKLKRADTAWMLKNIDEQHNKFEAIFRGIKAK